MKNNFKITNCGLALKKIKMTNISEVKNLIYIIREQKVMLDSDLAALYEVETRTLNQAVKRNIKRFPSHYMFQLTDEEWQNLRSQIVIFSKDIRKFRPYAFTEQGIAMLSSVLKSEKAIQINIQIMDTFVTMRQWALENKDLAKRISELEHYFIQHCKDNKADIEKIYDAIGLLMDRTRPAKIGYKVD